MSSGNKNSIAQKTYDKFSMPRLNREQSRKNRSALILSGMHVLAFLFHLFF